MFWEAGDRKYELVDGWGCLPRGQQAWGMVAAVAVDSKDNVHVFSRTENPYMVLDKSGKLLSAWGKGIFVQAHGICVLPDDNVIVVDRSPHVVLKFTNDGRHLMGLGNRDHASDTGYTDDEPIVRYPGPAFHYPTDAAYDEKGDIYISDGYGNCRVHKYTGGGEHLFSWGEPGDGEGQFRLVHGVWEHKNRVYVADRMNHRIQIFTHDGEYIDQWPGFRQPCKIYVDKDDIMYVAEYEARVSIVDLEGNVLGRWGGQASKEPGEFMRPHWIWTDSAGDIYVSEVQGGDRLQKFARVR